MVSGQAYRIFSFGYTLPEIPAELVYFAKGLWRNFLGAGVLFGLAGVITSFRKRPAVAAGMLLSFLFTIIFYVNYRVADKDTMFLPAYLCWAVFLFEGLLAAEQWMRSILHDLTSTRARSLVVMLLFLVFLPAPFLNWQWVDMHEADSFSIYARQVFSSADQDAVVIAPWSHAVVLEYYQIVLHHRADIKIVNSSRVNVARYYQQWVKGYPHGEILQTISGENAALIRETCVQGQSLPWNMMRTLPASSITFQKMSTSGWQRKSRRCCRGISWEETDPYIMHAQTGWLSSREPACLFF